jgi:hypothetical protein
MAEEGTPILVVDGGGSVGCKALPIHLVSPLFLGRPGMFDGVGT